VDIGTVSRHLSVVQPQPLVNPDVPRLPRLPLTLEQQSALIAFYCQSKPPPGIQRWNLRLAAKHINEGKPSLLGRTVHHSTIERVLSRNFLRPHRSSYFLHIRDPLFFEKMHHILWVLARKLKYLFCFDECPSIQAIGRRGPDQSEDDGSTRREFVYERHGTFDLFGFLHVDTGKSKGRQG
jgi:hypothetical protein